MNHKNVHHPSYNTSIITQSMSVHHSLSEEQIKRRERERREFTARKYQQIKRDIKINRANLLEKQEQLKRAEMELNQMKDKEQLLRAATKCIERENQRLLEEIRKHEKKKPES